LNKSDITLPRSAINDQRIDNWLFRSRIIKSRAKAQKIIFDGLVRINKVKISKSSIKIKIGDIVTLNNIENIIIFSVQNFANKRLNAKEAINLYKKIKIV
jgi:ribosome-associated heat shock protein Hsp15